MIQPWEKQYLQVLHKLTQKAEAGAWRAGRTAERYVSEFGLQLSVDIAPGQLPALLTKTVHLKSVIAELMWFLRGETNVAWLRENGCTIWDEWADEDGELGPVYGYQWRSWPAEGGHTDQIAKLLYDLLWRPNSRRMLVSAWNVADLPDDDIHPQGNVGLGQQALAPCHLMFQAFVEELSLEQRVAWAGKYAVPEELARLQVGDSRQALADILDRYDVPRRGLALRVDQRSADWFLGVPFNIASYAALGYLLSAAVGNLVPTKLVMQFGDYHLYENQLDCAREQLDRYANLAATGHKPRELSYPRISIPAPETLGNLSQLELSDVQLEGYVSMGRIVAPPPAV